MSEWGRQVAANFMASEEKREPKSPDQELTEADLESYDLYVTLMSSQGYNRDTFLSLEIMKSRGIWEVWTYLQSQQILPETRVECIQPLSGRGVSGASKPRQLKTFRVVGILPDCHVKITAVKGQASGVVDARTLVNKSSKEDLKSKEMSEKMSVEEQNLMNLYNSLLEEQNIPASKRKKYAQLRAGGRYSKFAELRLIRDKKLQIGSKVSITDYSGKVEKTGFHIIAFRPSCRFEISPRPRLYAPTISARFLKFEE